MGRAPNIPSPMQSNGAPSTSQAGGPASCMGKFRKKARPARRRLKPSRATPRSPAPPPPSTTLGWVRHWANKACEAAPHTVDLQVRVTSELRPPAKQLGKRRKPCPRVYSHQVIGPQHTWAGLKEFAVMLCALLSLTAGTRASSKRVMGADMIGITTHAIGATCLLFDAHQCNGLPNQGVKLLQT